MAYLVAANRDEVRSSEEADMLVRRRRLPNATRISCTPITALHIRNYQLHVRALPASSVCVKASSER